MATPSVIPTNASRDTVSRVSRVTRGGRTLWYQLTVLQQPERARACGSGMKANSDRRPVDPPPVVELRIVEGRSVEEGKDVTFDYNANFFLYASLEHARQLAHGRVQTPAATNPPILTGVPASGMAYLDRPTEAGYFIFPDLSVRHEGRYRLSFSLFETTKEEQDFDVDHPPRDSPVPVGVDWRMEIKTQAFNVYSAKKFPGLMQSTQLSKTVADQGCRVRIRRDVRMRKRDGAKSSSGYDRREEEYPRRRTVTPVPEDPHGIRARSLSSSSEHRVPYGDVSRRPSAVDGYAVPPPPPPPSYEPAPSVSRHLSFGDPAAAQYPTPRQYAPQSNMSLPPVSPTGPYASASQSPYVKADTPSSVYMKPETPGSVYMKPETPLYGKSDMSGYGKPEAPGYVKQEVYGYSRPMMQTCPSPAGSMKQEYYDRRASNSTYVPPSPSVHSVAESLTRRSSHASYPITPATPAAPATPKPPAGLSISSLITPMSPIEACDGTSNDDDEPEVSVGGKRKHGKVFTQSSHPLYNGERQADPHYSTGRRAMELGPNQGAFGRAEGHIEVVDFTVFRH